LLSATSEGNLDILQLFVSKGADLGYVDSDGWSCLQYAVQNGHNELIEYLLDQGFDINQGNSSDTLILAMHHYKMETAIYLVQKDISYNKPSSTGITAKDYCKLQALSGLEIWTKLLNLMEKTIHGE
jgi:hypothetical protein